MKTSLFFCRNNEPIFENSRSTTRTEREVEPTDRQIDQLVYELYGLTDDEIKIVEEATGT